MFATVQVGGRKRYRALVVGQFKGQGLDATTRRRDEDGAIASAARRPEATGERGRVVEAFPASGRYERVLVVGLGAREEFDSGVLREVSAAAGRRLADARLDAAEVDLSGPVRAARADATAAGVAFGEGIELLAWTCDEFRGRETPRADRPGLQLGSADRDFEAGMSRGVALARSANLARTLSQTPPNICTPMYVARQARQLARETGLRCRVLRGAELAEAGLEGLRTVGGGSANEPCLIRLEYRPRQRAAARPAVLVGKTMTYDSGGLSLKINNTMRGMKRDKDGGCAILGAMHAVATTIRPRRPVVALLAAAENAVSDRAYRPDDVIRFLNGVSVEVTNTDAEGRLVLADALCWACRYENPAFIVDLATLTGGIVVALGRVYAGLWCEHDRLRDHIQRASDVSGERVWRMPMHREYRDMMKSSVADIVNSAPVREAHPVQGAAFLSYFVEPDVPWAHIDIAGVHEVSKDTGPFVEGSTGWGVRLLANLLEAW